MLNYDCNRIVVGINPFRVMMEGEVRLGIERQVQLKEIALHLSQSLSSEGYQQWLYTMTDLLGMLPQKYRSVVLSSLDFQNSLTFVFGDRVITITSDLDLLYRKSLTTMDLADIWMPVKKGRNTDHDIQIDGYRLFTNRLYRPALKEVLSELSTRDPHEPRTASVILNHLATAVNKGKLPENAVGCQRDGSDQTFWISIANVVDETLLRRKEKAKK